MEALQHCGEGYIMSYIYYYVYIYNGRNLKSVKIEKRNNIWSYKGAVTKAVRINIILVYSHIYYIIHYNFVLPIWLYNIMSFRRDKIMTKDDKV